MCACARRWRWRSTGKAILRRTCSNGAYGEEALTVLPPGTANVDLTAEVDWAGKTMDERRAEAKRCSRPPGFGPSKPLKFTYNFSTYPDNSAHRGRDAIDVEGHRRRGRNRSPTERKVHSEAAADARFDVGAGLLDLSTTTTRGTSSTCARARRSR